MSHNGRLSLPESELAWRFSRSSGAGGQHVNTTDTRVELIWSLTDTTEPVYGSVDKKTQRAAWTVADRKTPVYEAGIANLTKDETTMLAHFSKDNSQQFTLVRIQQPEGSQQTEGK